MFPILEEGLQIEQRAFPHWHRARAFKIHAVTQSEIPNSPSAVRHVFD